MFLSVLSIAFMANARDPHQMDQTFLNNSAETVPTNNSAKDVSTKAIKVIRQGSNAKSIFGLEAAGYYSDGTVSVKLVNTGDQEKSNYVIWETDPNGKYMNSIPCSSIGGLKISPHHRDYKKRNELETTNNDSPTKDDDNELGGYLDTVGGYLGTAERTASRLARTVADTVLGYSTHDEAIKHSQYRDIRGKKELLSIELIMKGYWISKNHVFIANKEDEIELTEALRKCVVIDCVFGWNNCSACKDREGFRCKKITKNGDAFGTCTKNTDDHTHGCTFEKKD